MLLTLFRFLRFLLAFLLTLLWLQRRERSLLFQPLRLCNFRFHLQNQHLQLLFALLAGMGIDIAGVFLAIGLFGRIEAFKEMVVDLGDAAGTGSALAAHIGLEIGHTRLFRLGRGSFLPRL